VANRPPASHGYYLRRQSRLWAAAYLEGATLQASGGEGLLHSSAPGAVRALPEVLLHNPFQSFSGGVLPGQIVRAEVAAADFGRWLAAGMFTARACRPLSAVKLSEALGGGRGAQQAVASLLRLADPGTWSGVDEGVARAAFKRHLRLLRIRSRRLVSPKVRLGLLHPDKYTLAIGKYIDNQEQEAWLRGLLYPWQATFRSATVILAARLHLLGGSDYLLKVAQPTILAVAGAVAGELLGQDRLLLAAREVLDNGHLLYPRPGWFGPRLRPQAIALTLPRQQSIWRRFADVLFAH